MFVGSVKFECVEEYKTMHSCTHKNLIYFRNTEVVGHTVKLGSTKTHRKYPESVGWGSSNTKTKLVGNQAASVEWKLKIEQYLLTKLLNDLRN